jgi:hypothetical protein
MVKQIEMQKLADMKLAEEKK